MAFDNQQLNVEEELVDFQGKSSRESGMLTSAQDGDVEEQGKLMNAALNMSVGSFIPDLFFEKVVNNFKLAQQLYGETILRQVTGYNISFLEKNIRIPEFKKMLKEKIKENLEKLKEQELLDEDFGLTKKAVDVAAMTLYKEELDRLAAVGIGNYQKRKIGHYGERDEEKIFRKGDRYKDIALKRSVHIAVKRGHERLATDDLRSFSRREHGKIEIIYALDASGSMKGEKLATCKKAGIALAYAALDNKDSVGLVVFGKIVDVKVHPTDDFGLLIRKITAIMAKRETNLVGAIEEAAELFSRGNATKHLVLITDALPTTGKDPENETKEAVSRAAEAGITLSLVGIKLNEKGEALAKQLIEIGSGRLYVTKDLEHIDMMVLEDYFSL
ncbi:VWA domain-containing protein [Candidatus Woesearchaeota archaeon]|nr:VWA domain-containing protein [Candidatus Woesearchaeota archaeon]HIH38702.1 VWA domain-containing protein [Candidatus Woesearchaeota archaeon]HIJ03594.1 VWA domain-containing protein [Candidatus Woesearchaeota archaeon]